MHDDGLEWNVHDNDWNAMYMMMDRNVMCMMMDRNVMCMMMDR